MTHIFREHNQEADHIVNLGAEAGSKVTVETVKNTEMTGHNGSRAACGGVLLVGALSGTSWQRSETKANMANKRCQIPGVGFLGFQTWENRPRRKSHWKRALKKMKHAHLWYKITEENRRRHHCHQKLTRKMIGATAAVIACWVFFSHNSLLEPRVGSRSQLSGRRSRHGDFFATHVVGMSHPYTQFVHSSVVVTCVSPATDQNHENRTLGSRIALSNSHVFIHLTIHTHHTCSSTCSSLQISRGPKKRKACLILIYSTHLMWVQERSLLDSRFSLCCGRVSVSDRVSV